MDDLIKYRMSSAKEKLTSAKLLLRRGCIGIPLEGPTMLYFLQ